MSRAVVKLEQINHQEQSVNTALPENASLRDQVIAALREIYDPEIPVNLYDLGLIYDIQIDAQDVAVVMTLTTPHCPVAESMPGQVQAAIEAIEDVHKATVTLTWDPPWNMDNMSDEVKLTLGML